jgi:hypothetical protein
MFDFVNPVGADRRLRSFDRLSGDDEPGRKTLDFHRPEKISRRGAGNTGRSGIEGQRRVSEADVGPVRYLATLLGADSETPCDGLCLWRPFARPRAVLRCSPRRRRRGIEARKPDFRSKEAIVDWLALLFTVRLQTPRSPKLILIPSGRASSCCSRFFHASCDLNLLRKSSRKRRKIAAQRHLLVS